MPENSIGRHTLLIATLPIPSRPGESANEVEILLQAHGGIPILNTFGRNGSALGSLSKLPRV